MRIARADKSVSGYFHYCVCGCGTDALAQVIRIVCVPRASHAAKSFEWSLARCVVASKLPVALSASRIISFHQFYLYATATTMRRRTDDTFA